MHLSLTANSPAEPSKDLHKRSAVPMAASFPAVTCMANPDGSAAIPRVLLQKLPWGLLCLLLQRFHVRRGGGGRGCPSYAVIQPGATSSVNILLSGAQGHPAVLDSVPCPGWCSKSLVVIFSPLNLFSSELSLESLALSCGLVHKTTSFQGKRMSTIVCFAHLLLEGFS